MTKEQIYTFVVNRLYQLLALLYGFLTVSIIYQSLFKEETMAYKITHESVRQENIAFYVVTVVIALTFVVFLELVLFPIEIEED